jgi:hypothetical protein
MKQLFNIKEQDTLNAEESILLMQIGDRHCSFAIVSKTGKELQQLFYYNGDSCSILLPEILNIHPELKAPFSRSLISYDVEAHIFIPFAFYAPEDSAAFIRALYGNAEHIAADKHDGPEIYNSYGAPSSVHELITRVFPSAEIRHAQSAVLLNARQDADKDRIVVDFKTDRFSVIAIRKNLVLLAQSYPYVTSGDVLYRLLKICVEYSLSQQDSMLELSGLIDHQSAVYEDLHQYFLHVGFLSAGIHVAEHPPHFFSSLFNLLSCAS